jgi:hypothetical protein
MSRFKGWTHWTPAGTFSVSPKMLATSRFYELRFRDILLGTYEHEWSAAESISKGDHDPQIGTSGASLNVPAEPFDWNGFA